MTKHAMTSADRTKIIAALKTNPNAAAVARQFGFGKTTILTLCKKEGIGLQHLLTKAERTEVIDLLKTNLNALATAKQLGVNNKTVLAVAKKERIDIKAMRQAAKGRKTLPFTQWARGLGGELVLQCAVYLSDGSRLCPSLNTANTEAEGRNACGSFFGARLLMGAFRRVRTTPPGLCMVAQLLSPPNACLRA